MIDSRQMNCELCKKSVPVSDIKYMPKGIDAKMAVCSACRAKTMQAQKGGPLPFKKEPIPGAGQKVAIGNEDFIMIKTVPKEDIPMTEKTKSPEHGEKVMYRCERCNYKFKHDTAKVKVPRCPYCGKSDKVSEYRGS